jgi:quercetin 2,3-dioxygenase
LPPEFVNRQSAIVNGYRGKHLLNNNSAVVDASGQFGFLILPIDDSRFTTKITTMISQSSGKMFLAAERGHTETGTFRSYNTFNFGNYQSEHKAPFGGLYVLNDDTLAGKKGLQLLVEDNSDIIIIPTVGAVTYKDSAGNANRVEAGQIQVQTLLKGTTMEIANPYEEELVNFLQLWIKQPGHANLAPARSSFDLANRNQLLPLLTHPAISIGKFTGREEWVYKITQPGHGVFVFVLEGAFEVQYRLLEVRDGLALWDIDEIEIEALSNDAIILVAEIPLR